MAGNGTSELSGRFIPPQPNSSDNSLQDTDNSNTTTVYYEKSTGGHVKTRLLVYRCHLRIQEPTGTTTVTQTSHKTALQAGGNQTPPPPYPKKSTLTGGTQTSPPKDNSC